MFKLLFFFFRRFKNLGSASVVDAREGDSCAGEGSTDVELRQTSDVLRYDFGYRLSLCGILYHKHLICICLCIWCIDIRYLCRFGYSFRGKCR